MYAHDPRLHPPLRVSTQGDIGERQAAGRLERPRRPHEELATIPPAIISEKPIKKNVDCSKAYTARGVKINVCLLLINVCCLKV